MSENLQNWIKHHEGFSTKPYKDTVGKLTIGYGHNLDDLGITQEEAQYLLENDIKRCQSQLQQFSWFTNQPENVKDALTNMCFNVGITRLLGFKKMIAALTKKDYTVASMEALDSKWAQQVGQRAKDVALMIRQG